VSQSATLSTVRDSSLRFITKPKSHCQDVLAVLKFLVPLNFKNHFMKTVAMDALTKTFQHSLVVASVFGAIVASGAPAEAVAITTFTFTDIDPINTPLPSYSEVSGPLATRLTADNAVGVDLPPAGGITGNSSGICAFLQNSSGTGNRRCGLTNTNGGTDNSSVTSIDLTFTRSVFLRSFEVQAFNNLLSAQMAFGGSTPFTITGVGVNNFVGDFLVAANTPISLQTSSVVYASGQSGAIRIDNIVVEDVPGPLPLLGISAAFAYGRKLRKKFPNC
jgi:hypothetical protein